MLALITIFSVWISAFGDVYLNNPRGSNNKLSEQSNNVQNDNRLFDSQNNAAAGYQVGDDCRPVCQNGNRDYDASKEGAMQGMMTLVEGHHALHYDASKEGAMQGMMTFYQGSELYLEWHAQHGCGLGHPNLHCQMILQYMSEGDNPNLRDGTKRGNQNTAGGRQEPPDTEEARDPTLGQHEPVKFYQDCRARERNKGLYTADQNVNNNRGATATRQNPNGNANANQRHGLECPEERDYYPYWHPTPWHDIAIFTDEPLERCAYYQGESQNRRAKGLCSEPAHNNPASCQQAGAEWSEQAAFDEPAPECVGGIQSRDNHNGNVRNGRPMYYVWHVPHHVQGRTVLRLRYNITTLDLEPSAVAAGVDDEASTGTTGDTTDSAKTQDAFFIDERFNDRNPSQRRRSIFRPGRPVVSNDPKADWLGLGSDEKPRVLQVQLNTNQVARTFEDRTHTFMVQARPSTVPAGARIVNYNVRGRRGNIVQVYPSVEYDFVPQELTVEAGTFVHFQWVGSDANPKGNAGNGRQGTDRSNLVQVAARGENLPLPIEQHTLFFDAQADPLNEEGRAIADRFAYLDQDKLVTCDVEEDDNQAVDNCKQLNGASAYFNGGVIELTQVGTHHVASTRNNDFSNRSQKATIIVTPKPWTWLQIALLSLGVALALSSGVYLAAACYATLEPTSWLFSSRYRPRVLRFCLPNQVYQRKLEERRSFHRKRKEHLAALVAADDAQEFLAVGKALDADDSEAGDRARPGRRSGDRSRPASKKASVAPLESSSLSCLRSCRYCGFGEQRMALLLYFIMNVFAFAIGFLSHLGMGFEGSLAYPFAKGCGYMLDLNFAFLVLPTLKSLQTALRGAGSTREWIPIDDPISFHIAMGFLTMLGSAGHVVSHIVHMWRIATAPPIQQDPLELWDLTPSERMSGMRIWDQCLNLNNRCAAVTGIILVLLMVLMTLTALPCARRGTNCCTRRLGGYNLFRRVHSAWKLIYVLLLLHAPQRLWIWLVFPAILLAVDRVFLANRQRPYVALRQVKLLPRQVIHLTFDVPHGFTYQAGQYILLGWRGEWHPFTLTSAPEEQSLSVHIRSPDNLDWCSALRKFLVQGSPGASGSTVVHYVSRTTRNGQLVYSQPRQDGTSAATSSAAGSGPTEVAIEIPREASGISLDSTRCENLPADAVVLQITGPFGAPAQKIWQFQTIMAVGAGIGVTPFASILKSVQLRAKQRQAIQGALGGTRSKPARRKDDELAGARQSVEQLLNNVVTVPHRIYFYWLVRSQDEVEWFWDLLAEAVQGPAQENVHVTLFTTGEIELKQVRQMSFVHSQVFGRPNWDRIFKQQREQHKGEHVGVFLCGSPAIGAELGRQSAKYSDQPSCTGGTRFSFFKEHF